MALAAVLDRCLVDGRLRNLFFGAIAQLGERSVRNAEVGGSTPLRSIFFNLEIQ